MLSVRQYKEGRVHTLLLVKLVSVAVFLIAAALSAFSWRVLGSERWGLRFAMVAIVFFVPMASINDW